MEYTGIGKEKEEFVPRKNAEEFFQDGKAIEELYKKTFQLLFSFSTLKSSNVLHVFNNAYRICQSCICQKPYNIKFRNVERKNYSYAVALVLLQLHQKFYSISDETFHNLKANVGNSIWRRYHTFAQENELTHPIFCGKKRELDFELAKECMIIAMDEATRLQEDNKELRKQLEEERAKRVNAERTIQEKQERLDLWENDAFYKAVNINSILKYAQDRGNCDNNDIKTIRMMLLALCANKVPNDLIESIKTLKLGGNITIGEQHNHGCQQFYGPITDSEFPSK